MSPEVTLPPGKPESEIILSLLCSILLWVFNDLFFSVTNLKLCRLLEGAFRIANFCLLILHYNFFHAVPFYLPLKKNHEAAATCCFKTLRKFFMRN